MNSGFRHRIGGITADGRERTVFAALNCAPSATKVPIQLFFPHMETVNALSRDSLGRFRHSGISLGARCRTDQSELHEVRVPNPDARRQKALYCGLRPQRRFEKIPDPAKQDAL